MLLGHAFRAAGATAASYAAAWMMLTDIGAESQLLLYGVTLYLSVILFALLTISARPGGS